jgi:HEAT repeat protein
MRRLLRWSLVLLAVGLPAAGAGAAPPVEEWQVRGILAALKDGYPQVRGLAAAELGELLQPGAPREWRGQSQTLAREAEAGLRELLGSDDADLRTRAARPLALLLGRAGDAAALRELLRDPEPGVTWHAALALARISEEAGDVPALRGLLSDPHPYVRWHATQALVRLHEGARDAAALRGLLKDANPDARREAAQALARLGDKEGAPVLRDFLKSKDADADARSDRAAEALAQFYERGKEASALRALLRDTSRDARAHAARALGRLSQESHDAAALRELQKDTHPEVRREAAAPLARLHESEKDTKALRDMLNTSDPDAYREAAAALVRLYEAAKDVPALRDVHGGADPGAARDATWALARLGQRDAVPALHKLLRDPNPETRRETAELLARTGEPDLLPVFLVITYEDTTNLFWARWQVYYWGGKNPDIARVLCAYLGRPSDDPTVPVTDAPGKGRRENALSDLRVLRQEAWEKTDSPWLQEDVARAWWWVTTEEVTGWRTSEDVEELRNVRDALQRGSAGRRYLPGIERVLEPFEIVPSPFVRTWIMAGFLNVLALALLVAGWRLGAAGRWLPVAGYVVGALAVGYVDLARWEPRPHTIPWLLGLISVGEAVLLVGAAMVSPMVLRLASRLEPLGRIARPLALRRSGTRRRFLDDYAAAVAGQVSGARDRAAFEEYIVLPAAVRSERDPTATRLDDPAAEILAFLTGAQGSKGSVLIEAPAGRGKSALVREVVSRALDRHRKGSGRQPLPVLLSGGGGDVETQVATAVAPLEAGDFFVVLDAVSESGPSADALAQFVSGPRGRATPLLLATRPGHGYGAVIRASHGMTVAPLALDEEGLRRFVDGYGGSPLSDALKSACRGPDGKYLPRLVRMALVVGGSADGPATVPDLYRAYFLKSLEGQVSAEAERVRRLEEASRWCVETYWRDGLRRRRYEPGDSLQRLLRQAGLLTDADAGPEPKEVLFADATMQSYLTAHGLATQDRGRVLLRAAADARLADRAELFHMCLATFGPKKALREWLFGELKRWAACHAEDLPRHKVLAAVPAGLADSVRGVRAGGPLLAEAARLSFEADAARDSVETLGRLYAGVAPLVYDLEAEPPAQHPAAHAVGQSKSARKE